MKIPFQYMAILFLALIAVIAGCNGSPSSADPAMSIKSVGLAQFALQPSEIPFIVADEKSQVPDILHPQFSEFGALRGFTRFSISEKTMSPTSVQLGQTIVEYPPGNVTLAFDAFKEQNLLADQSRYKITWLPDPGIGDRSCALIIADSSGAENPTAMIVFTKTTIMESVVMIGPSTDIDALTRSARAAAAKIP